MDTNTTAPDLDALVAKWRKLVPADVEIYIRWDENISEFDRANSVSLIETNTLFITIAPMEPSGDYEGSLGFRITRDVELDVVHEMLHWRFDLFMENDKESPKYRACEAAIERTAQDLLRENRERANAS